MKQHRHPLRIRLVRDTIESLADQVHRALLADIVAGAYEPGRRLNEGVLAERFGVSKSPVREALARLVRDGHLDVHPRIGYAVTALTVDDVEDLFAYRAVLECASAQFAATRITAAELRHLDLLADVAFLPHARETYANFFAQNRKFHLRIARASRNAHLVRALTGLFDKVDRLLRYRLDVDSSLERIQAEHRMLVDALRRADAALARDLLAEQIREGKEQIIDGLLTEIARGRSEMQAFGE